MKFNFKYRGRVFNLEVKKCKNIFSKAGGLMFRRKSRPLLFVFEKPANQAIHSFFCRPFVAIWFKNEKIVDVKTIKSWKFFIKPKKEFNKLLEMPSNNKNFLMFADGKRKI